MHSCGNRCTGVRVEFFIFVFSFYCVATSTSDYAQVQQQQQQQQQHQQQPTDYLPFDREQLVLLDPFSDRQVIALRSLPLMWPPYRPKTTLAAGNSVGLPQLWSPTCTCAEYECTCCLGLSFGTNSKNRVCTELQFNAEQLALQLRIAYNQNTIGNFGISPVNQPDYCLPVVLPLPLPLPLPLYSCLRLYDIRTFGGGNVHLCITFVLKVFTNQIFEYHFDCVQFGVNGVALAKTQQPHDAEAHSVEDLLLRSEKIVKSTVTVETDNDAAATVASAASAALPANDKLNNDDFQRLQAALS